MPARAAAATAPASSLTRGASRRAAPLTVDLCGKGGGPAAANVPPPPAAVERHQQCTHALRRVAGRQVRELSHRHGIDTPGWQAPHPGCRQAARPCLQTCCGVKSLFALKTNRPVPPKTAARHRCRTTPAGLAACRAQPRPAQQGWHAMSHERVASGWRHGALPHTHAHRAAAPPWRCPVLPLSRALTPRESTRSTSVSTSPTRVTTSDRSAAAQVGRAGRTGRAVWAAGGAARRRMLRRCAVAASAPWPAPRPRLTRRPDMDGTVLAVASHILAAGAHRQAAGGGGGGRRRGVGQQGAAVTRAER